VWKAKLTENKAREQEIKNNMLSIKNKALEGSYVDVATMNYYLSFIPRALLEGIRELNKKTKDLKYMFTQDKDKDAIKIIAGVLESKLKEVMTEMEKERDGYDTDQM
jgi:hypothetical protein